MPIFNFSEPRMWNFREPVRNTMPVRFRVLVDGEATSTLKRLRLTAGGKISERGTLAIARLTEFSSWFEVYDRVWLSRESWLVIVEDLEAEPPLYQGAVMAIQAAGTYTINIWTGSGGAGGDPASVDGFVRVEGVPASREVVALERTAEGEWRVAGFSRLESGAGEIPLKLFGDRVYSMAVDDFGIEFLPGLPVSVGQRIRPTSFRGWLYQITEAGQLPATEPEWWSMEGENPSRPLGTARAVAVRYFRPLALGPEPVEKH